jgi:hypothetical protein
MPDPTKTTPSDSDAVQRRFLDEEGRSWRVREARVPPYDRRNGVVLLFESNEVLRIVRDYPANWHTLSNADLMQLSMRV